jgi:hypothetical protein
MITTNTKNALKKTRLICMAVAAKDTAYLPLEHLWTPEDPLAEHCGAVAYVVQQIFGGDIMSGHDDNGVRWLWNKLPDGEYAVTEPDLIPRPKKPGKRLPSRKTINPRFKLFCNRFTDYRSGK